MRAASAVTRQGENEVPASYARERARVNGGRNRFEPDVSELVEHADERGRRDALALDGFRHLDRRVAREGVAAGELAVLAPERDAEPAGYDLHRHAALRRFGGDERTDIAVPFFRRHGFTDVAVHLFRLERVIRVEDVDTTGGGPGREELPAVRPRPHAQVTSRVRRLETHDDMQRVVATRHEILEGVSVRRTEVDRLETLCERDAVLEEH